MWFKKPNNKHLGNAFINVIGLDIHHDKVIEVLSNIDVKLNTIESQQNLYCSRTEIDSGYINTRKTSKAHSPNYEFIKSVIVFNEGGASLPFNLKWDDDFSKINTKMQKTGAIKKQEYWLLNNTKIDYYFKPQLDLNYYELESVNEEEIIHQIGVFEFDIYWKSRDRITVSWNASPIQVRLEDDKNIFSKNNLLFIQDVLQNKDLKKEIEQLVFNDFLKNKSLNVSITTAIESRKFLKECLFLEISKAKKITICYNHRTSDFGIEISGKIGGLVLKYTRLTK